MKTKILTTLAACSAIILASACNKDQASVQQPSNTEETTLEISLQKDSGFDTRADRYAVNYDPVGKEATLKDVQFFIFNGGEFEKYVHISDWDTYTKTSSSLNVGVKLGSKKVVAVCNGPDLSAVDNYQTLRSQTLDLGTVNNPDTGFAMFGEDSCKVTGNTPVSCSVNVSRYVAKIYIGRIRNNLPPQFGNITLVNAFLANVPSRITIGGTVNDSYWINKYGRKNETPLVSSHIINGTTCTAEAPKLTFLNFSSLQIASGDSTSAFSGMYSYPNSHTNVINTFSTTFTACCTKLVIAATIDGQLNYFPINLGQVERNHVYAIFLTISGLGSDDPASSVVKGSIESTITISDWQHSNPIVEDI